MVWLIMGSIVIQIMPILKLIPFIAFYAVIGREAYPQDSAVARLGNPSQSQWILESRDGVTRAAGLTPLASTALSEGSDEIRLWIGEGLGVPEQLYRIVRTQGRVSGDLIYFWDIGDRGGAERDEPDFNLVLLYSLAGQCRQVGKEKNAYACLTKLAREPDWDSILGSMEDAGVWTLPDESELPSDGRMIMDGWGMLVEVRRGSVYRAYHHSNPHAHDNPVSRSAVSISAAINGVDSLTAPAENRRRYRGHLIIKLESPWREPEFIPCGETTPWRATGNPVGMIYEAHKSETLQPIHRYVEVRGLREYPGLTRYYSEYDDGIHIDTLYRDRPWDPAECD
jgi:hypothetical protein